MTPQESRAFDSLIQNLPKIIREIRRNNELQALAIQLKLDQCEAEGYVDKDIIFDYRGKLSGALA